MTPINDFVGYVSLVLHYSIVIINIHHRRYLIYKVHVCMYVYIAIYYVNLNFSQLASQITVHGIPDSKSFFQSIKCLESTVFSAKIVCLHVHAST